MKEKEIKRFGTDNNIYTYTLPLLNKDRIDCTVSGIWRDNSRRGNRRQDADGDQ